MRLDLKYPPEFLEHNKCLASVGSSLMPHYKCFCGRAVQSAARVLALGVLSLCACAALGGAICILIYAPDRNRITAIRKMWLSCFYSGKTVIKDEKRYASKAIFFFPINSLLFVLLYFITFSPPAGFNISHVLWSPRKQ